MFKNYKISDFLTRVRFPVHIDDELSYRLVTIRMRHQGVCLRTTKPGIDIGTKIMYRVKAGQFILSGIDARNGAFGIIPEELDGAVVTNDFWYFDIDESIIDKAYFLYLTSTSFFDNLCRLASDGTTNRVRLQSDKFYSYEVSLPPIDDQRVVLEQLLQANGKLNALQTELNQQDELLKKLQQAILQDAIQGKLTARWREQHGPATETGTQLLAFIQAAKAELVKQKKLKKEKPLPPITDAEKPFELPDGWVWCRLGEAGILDRGKSKHRPRNDERLFKNGSVPFIQTGDVAQSKKTGFLIKSYSTTYNEFGLAQSRLWPSGTLCITIAANIAETGFLTFDACFPDSVVGFTPLNDQATSSFVRYFIDVSKSYIERYAPATAQKNINLGILGELYFPLPPLTEQQAIVEAVELAMEKLGQLREELSHQSAQAGELLKALLHRAFQVEEANEVDVATPIEA